jgi:hypothetical protein
MPNAQFQQPPAINWIIQKYKNSHSNHALQKWHGPGGLLETVVMVCEKLLTKITHIIFSLLRTLIKQREA